MVNFNKKLLKNNRLLLISSLILFLIILNKILSYKKIKSGYQELKRKLIRINEEVPENQENPQNAEDNLEFESNVNKVCKKASPDLQKYYETYDTSIIDVSSMSLEEIEYYPDYIKSIINLIENEGDMQENLMNYLKHAIPSFMFIILGIVSVIAWLFFSFFCCCNCCCCCCCKKEECKCSCLVAPLIFDLIIIISCLAGIFSANKMFTGLADVECSLMKFISEINTGEKKKDDLRWVGFEEILKTFDKIKDKINEIKTNTETELNNNYDILTIKKENFPDTIKETYTSMLDPFDPDSPLIFDTKYLTHVMREGTLDKLDFGVIDILYEYGPMKTDEKFLYKLYEQYKLMTEQADIYLKKAHDSFINILKEDSISQIIDSSKQNIEEISSTLNGIKDQIAKYVIDYSDPIESYGKYIVKIIYVAIISLAGFSAFSLILMYITAEECCYGKCCCGKGLTKTLSHISWNLMSLTMILSFIICGIVFLLSYLGKDLVQVMTVIVGQKNLFGKKPILIKGNANIYFNVCFHGDGDLGFLFGLTSNESSTYEFDELNNIINDISEVKEKVSQNDVVINAFKESLENRKNYKDVNVYDFNTETFMNLDNLIYTFNELIKNDVFDVWTLNETCPDENYLLVHCPENISTIERKSVDEEPVPKECLNFKEWKIGYESRYKSPPILVLDMTYTTVLKAARYFVNVVNNITDYIDYGEALTTLTEKLAIVEETYNDVIETELEVLDIYNKTIYELISVFNELNNGGDSFFSFLNCKFIGNNVLIILKNLQGAFAGSVQTIGLTLVFASFGMFFSIFFTILEIVILNVSLYLQRRRKEKEEQITLALGIQTKTSTNSDTFRNEKVYKKKKRSRFND